ncbi:MAG: hypothetical protein K6G45_02795 [Lachnospiraceae bacterium]|nr:hypothetical protein [Lachnospiraceae bacterium]
MVKQDCNNKRKQLSDLIEKIDSKIISKRISNAGIEIAVTQSIDRVWEDYLFILNGILFRWENCNKFILEINDRISQLDHKDTEGIIFATPPREIADKLSYEFESLLVSFSRLNEEPLIVEISRHIKTRNKQKLNNNCYKKTDSNGLYWELNVLRNRAAHATPGYYTIHNDMAARYMSISSKISMIEMNDSNCVFRTSLLSYRNNRIIRQVVQEYIIDKKYGEEYSEKSIMELLFPNTKPSGKGKKRPIVLFMGGVKFFDLNNEFYELSNDLFGYMINQLEIFDDEID